MLLQKCKIAAVILPRHDCILEVADFLGKRANGEHYPTCRLADDIVLLSEYREDLQKMVRELHSKNSVKALKRTMKCNMLYFMALFSARQVVFDR